MPRPPFASPRWQRGRYSHRDGEPERHLADHDSPPHVRAEPGGLVRRAAAAALATAMPQYGGNTSPHSQPARFVFLGGLFFRCGSVRAVLRTYRVSLGPCYSTG